MPSSIYGYFDQAGTSAPAYDPGFEVPCPICLRPVGRHSEASPLKSISLMPRACDRSYFFRAHAGCWDGASQVERDQVEHALIDSLSP